ncbi:hypothetical protein BDP27DRAFT_1328108 [Rhodocollybia butyracea]|uniref:Zn(2)-C6 fungal-type domain-containing protein n=1 Tax=Rhodocollybia butyracea TaxID=206335 RepID=A0A9P5PEV6_9AGAR|nr:hypothetical protein BDP27DRAFT_1337121 [Rhodocollybia butyracea]KAF9067991.1 hypothetical protein BDP27DRAFT_1328108 [Rhodocollybia butyracea]
MSFQTTIALTAGAVPATTEHLGLQARHRQAGRIVTSACDRCWGKKRKCEMIKGRPDICRGCRRNKAGPCTFNRPPSQPATIVLDEDRFVRTTPSSSDYLEASPRLCKRCHDKPCICLCDTRTKWKLLSAADSGRQCLNCGVKHTTQWRRGPNNQVNCNKCGLYYFYHGRPRAYHSAQGRIDSKSLKSSKIYTNKISIVPNEFNQPVMSSPQPISAGSEQTNIYESQMSTLSGRFKTLAHNPAFAYGYAYNKSFDFANITTMDTIGTNQDVGSSTYYSSSNAGSIDLCITPYTVNEDKSRASTLSTGLAYNSAFAYSNKLDYTYNNPCDAASPYYSSLNTSMNHSTNTMATDFNVGSSAKTMYSEYLADTRGISRMAASACGTGSSVTTYYSDDRCSDYSNVIATGTNDLARASSFPFDVRNISYKSKSSANPVS